ncbi:glutathione S-transferase T2-like [Arachis duranensis]|uniref:Glutathione S-transferase T2-like n=1 Tax=Arachis duranensis TaxID=130453 RepID=A0A6P5MZV2_ARADU|nr:glutathione S-transferase T2-like [Arachis duranensis]
MTREVVACKKRWYKSNKAVAQFTGCYDQASRKIRSGSNADDIKELAYKLFIPQIMVKDSLLRGIGTCFGWSKNGEANYLHRVAAQREPRLVQLEHTHPHQTQKYRWLTNPVWTLPFAHKDQRRANEKNVRERKLMDREKEREEEKEHRAKIMAIKEKELQIQAAIKKQELQTQRYIKEMEIKAKEREMKRMAKEREREMDMQILNADTSTMSEKRRALHEIACEKIIAKWFT